MGVFLGTGASLGLTASAKAESRRQRTGEIKVQRVKNSTENSMPDDGPRTRLPAPTKTAGVVAEVAGVVSREGVTGDGEDCVVRGDSEGMLLVPGVIGVAVVEDSERLGAEIPVWVVDPGQ